MVLALVLVAAASAAPAPAGPVPGGSLDPTTIPKYKEPLVIPPAMPRTRRDPDALRPADRLLRDRRQAVRAVHPADGLVAGQRHRPDHRVELRVHDRPAAGRRGRHAQLPGVHHRGHQGQAGARQVDQRPGRRAGQLPAAPASPSTRPCTGPTRPAAPAAPTRTARTPDAVHRARADRHPRPRRAHDRGQRRLPGGLVPAGRQRTSRPATPPTGTYYEQFKQESEAQQGQTWEPGSADLPVPQRPAGDHAVVPRPHPGHDPRSTSTPGRPGFYLSAADRTTWSPGGCPGPRRSAATSPGTKYYEIPIAIQDRSFNADGSLFYPDNRAFFEGLNEPGSQQFPGARAAIPLTRHGAGRRAERHLAASGTPSSSATRWSSTARPGRT